MQNSLALKSVKVIGSTLELAALCVLFTGFILLSIPNWTDFFSSGLGVHWDTRLMGQWMAWNAHNILDGNFWRPDFNANFFYPHSYSLGFSEPLWPQSFVYALFYGATSNPYLSFNGTMLVFWVISGFTMLGLLRELGFSRGISIFGGLVFCLIPYRLGYYIEFNMTLVFSIPLLLMLEIRWLRSLTWTNTLLLVAGFWISATSCIYYTIMVSIPMLMIFLMHLARDGESRRDKKLWLHVIAAAVLAIGTVAIFLYPYWVLRVEGEFARTEKDISRHFAQALHYITPHSGEVDYGLLGIDLARIPSRWTEAIIFPGAVLMTLYLTHLIPSVVKPGEKAANVLLSFTQGFLWILLFGILLISPWFMPEDLPIGSPGHPLLVSIVPSLALLIFVIAFARFFVRPANENDSIAYIAAMGIAATVCFFISLGPDISVGIGVTLHTLGANPIEAALHNLPVFDAVRGLSRFSIIVLTFLLVASMMTLGRLVQYSNLAWPLIAVLCIILVYDGRQIRYEFADESWREKSAVVKRIKTLSPDQTLIQLPIGPREEDASATLNTIGSFVKLVNGHSGFAPPDYQSRVPLMREWNIPRLSTEIEKIWPSPWLVLDKNALNELAAGLRTKFPKDKLTPYWELVVEDEHYSLYKPKPRPSIPRGAVTRRVRSDVLERYTRLEFEFKTVAAGVVVSLNDVEVLRKTATDDWQKVSVELPMEAIGKIAGDTIVVAPDNGDALMVREMTFVESETNQSR